MPAPFTSLATPQPNAYGLSWEFDTEVLTMRSGLEQRIASRTIPTERVDNQYLLGDLDDVDQDASADLRALRADLFVNAVEPWGLPYWHEGAASAIDITGTAATVNATYLDWIVANQYVWVVGPNPTDAYYTLIVSTGGTLSARTLVLGDSPMDWGFVGDEFPANATFIYPIAGVVADRPVLGRNQGADGEWRLKGTTQTRWNALGTGGSISSFDSLPLLTVRPIMNGQAAEEQFVTDADRQERGSTILQSAMRDVNAIARIHNFVSAGPAEWAYWKKFFTTVVGRQKVFLLPTWRHDLIAPAGLDGTTTLVVTSPSATYGTDQPDYANDWFPSLAHRRLQFLFSDGSVAYRKVSAAVQSGDEQDLTLTTSIDEPVGTTLERISFLEQVRLGQDRLDFSIQQGRVVRFGFSSLVVQR